MKRALATLILASLLISTFPLGVSAGATDDIPTNVSATGEHDTLVAALTHAGLVSTLQGNGPFTVFAPTDQAFIDAGIDLSTFDTDDENATLTDILLYHVVSGKVMSTDLSDRTTADAVNGDKVSFSVTSEVRVNNALVTGADVESSNGVIHVIDKVLMPPVDVFVGDGSMAGAPYYQFYSDAAGSNEITEIDTSKNYNFQRLNNPSTHPFYISDVGYNTASSTDILIAGDGSASTGISDNETFTLFFTPDFDAQQDTLTYFCTVHSSMVADFTLASTLSDIPATATSTGIHTSLVAALAQANLVTTLQGTGPFTVFAPTDAAFTAAGIDLSSFDTDAENATLVDILTYHVVSGDYQSGDLSSAGTATALNGDNVTFTVNAAGVQVNDANVVTADVAATNGIIHVIDKVLMPPADLVDIPTVAAGTGIHTSLVAALTQANLVTTLQGTGPFTVFAPTDAAFAAAGIDLSTFDTDAENATLVDILTYHVVSGSVASTALTDGLTATALNGDNVTFTVNAAGVQVNDANVVTADVAASNGIIHVIDKVLMPPADPVPEPVLPDCDATVRIAPSGLKFTPSELTITVGQTVCWQWENESMAHNVRQVDGDQSTTYSANGISSGTAATTVDFRYTFDTDSTTFYYACEPHLAAGMFGKVIVGDGGVVEVTPPAGGDSVDDSDDESVPGFLAILTTMALAGAAFVSSRRHD
ncbi:MAG: fasciclin domain-containing protein [Candidatus Poseidoniaceae archaeon]|jgi:uncharacterized surface protein with fasciclin (FAS1) repeats|nr:fasciclin domain-containing protein [Candidatus Poseidoniaceae archaeon]